ncbi:DctP family TRAP transporter solute-binding subunit [Ectobacillus panaciterrae]|uniref:DctP family TRAP transporter solute-binding subunit n=1 Tax=Ectobacillus panaciterrae TaxID=363872 RepID=UPI000413AAAA|nr:DctP family TRAP transporter solute-binding subunit [Ectobacillus panaciterrae]
MNRISIIRFLQLAAILFFIIFEASCTPRTIDYDQVSPEEKLIIRFPHVTGENTPKGLAAKRFKELVEAKSGGKVEVQVFPNSSLYSDYEEIDQLKKGHIQIIAPQTAKFSNIIPEAQLFDLPYLFQNNKEVWELADGPVGKELGHLFEKKGYKLLAIWDNGFKQITNSKKPIKKPADFFGLNFRIVSSQVIANQFELVGADSSVLAFNELYQALEQGKFQGEENTVSNINNKKLYTLQKYMTKSDHGYLGYFIVTDKKFWDSIPRDTRKMLEDTLTEVTDWERTTAVQMEQDQYAQLQKQPELTIHELTSEEKKSWKASFHDAYNAYISSINNNVIKDYVKKKEQRVP